MNQEILNESSSSYNSAIQQVASLNGWTLESMSNETPTLIVFLRHLGCIYCRESLAELQRLRQEIEGHDVRIALIHMGSDEQARKVLEVFGLDDVERFSDPERRLYQAFGLERSHYGHFFNASSLLDMLKTGLSSKVKLRHSVGKVVGDILQLPGVFLLNQGKIIADFKTTKLVQRPDYLELAAMEC